MLNPFGEQKVPGSYVDLKKENIVLSRPERMRMFSQILRSVLEDMIRKLDDRSNSA